MYKVILETKISKYKSSKIIIINMFSHHKYIKASFSHQTNLLKSWTMISSISLWKLSWRLEKSTNNWLCHCNKLHLSQYLSSILKSLENNHYFLHAIKALLPLHITSVGYWYERVAFDTFLRFIDGNIF